MKFGQGKPANKIGEKTGYIVAYFLFTVLIYYLLKLLNKLPSKWTFFHVLSLTLLMTLIGIHIKRLLK